MGDGLEVSNPVPDTNNANNGDVLTYNGDTDEIVWVAPQVGSLPTYDSTDAGKVLAVNQAGDGVEWIDAGGGSSTQIIYYNTTTKVATLNGNVVTPGEVIELAKINPYIILRKCWNYEGETYYGYNNYYISSYLNGEQQLLYFVCKDFGSGDTGYDDIIRANNCDPDKPIWDTP